MSGSSAPVATLLQGQEPWSALGLDPRSPLDRRLYGAFGAERLRQLSGMRPPSQGEEPGAALAAGLSAANAVTRLSFQNISRPKRY